MKAFHGADRAGECAGNLVGARSYDCSRRKVDSSMMYVIYASLALLMIGLVRRRVVRFAFRLVVVLGGLALFAGVLVKSLHAQEPTIVVHPTAFFRIGVWDAVGLVDGAEVRMAVGPKKSQPVGGVDLIEATIRIIREYTVMATLNFTGVLYEGAQADLAKALVARWGMPEADVVCGTVTGMGHEVMCILFEVGLDGYTVASNGSRLYNPTLQVKLITSGELAFSGMMRNSSDFVVDSNGKVVW